MEPPFAQATIRAGSSAKSTFREENHIAVRAKQSPGRFLQNVPFRLLPWLSGERGHFV